MKIESSIYRVKVEYWIFGHRYHAFLTQACRPRHIFFIAGITLYCVGTVEQQWIVPAVAAPAAIYGAFRRDSKTKRSKPKGSRTHEEARRQSDGIRYDVARVRIRGHVTTPRP